MPGWTDRAITVGWLLISICGLAEAGGGLKVGFSSVEVTPRVCAEQPVWLAGYGWGRAATGVHDPLYARCAVLQHNGRRIALITVDVVGLQLGTVEAIRGELTDFSYVLVSSTHNHEGPDTIGIWGKSPLQRGVDEEYLQMLTRKIPKMVREAAAQAVLVSASFGTAKSDRLLADRRPPYVKDSTIRVLKFNQLGPANETVGIIVQWNCHPEALGPKNTLITADFPYATIQELKKRYDCPIAYFTGAVGGLMAPPTGAIHDDQGQPLREGQFEFAERYGQQVARLAEVAIERSTGIRLVPLRVSTQRVAIPVTNPLYRTASLLGIVRRPPVRWTGDFNDVTQRVTRLTPKEEFALATEVVCLQLGELKVIGIPGELYPELVVGYVEEPADPGADFPDARAEPSIAELMSESPWMLLGLANDEIGYIIPKRQWDQATPFTYGRRLPPYGEVNSCGPDVAPIVMHALKQRVEALAPTSPSK